jgi:hypothetical protein
LPPINTKPATIDRNQPLKLRTNSQRNNNNRHETKIFRIALGSARRYSLAAKARIRCVFLMAQNGLPWELSMPKIDSRAACGQFRSDPSGRSR